MILTPTEIKLLADEFSSYKKATTVTAADGHGGDGFSTPLYAYANCLAISTQFAQWLRDNRGIPAGLLHLHGMRKPLPNGASGRWPYTDPSTFGHWTVFINTGDYCWSIDFTAKQFDPSAPTPLILSVESLKEEWDLVEIWACESCNRLVDDTIHATLAPLDMAAEHIDIAQRTCGKGPFPDPRHLTSAPLCKICNCVK